MKESKDDKNDTKESEEEKGGTVVKIQDEKTIEKNDDSDINNNTVDRNSEFKTEGKIKLNKNFINQSKLDIVDKNDKLEESKGKLFTKIYRCFNGKVTLIISIIMIIYSLILMTFSIMDLVKYKNNNKNLFKNKVLFLVFDIINLIMIITYHIINYRFKLNESHIIIYVLIILYIISSVIRYLQFVKKDINMFSILIYICNNIFALLIACLTLIYLLIDSKKRMKTMHGIEEIINFSEINQKINKVEGLQLDISSNKDKPSTLVEEEDEKK